MGGDASAPLSATPTHRMYWLPGKTTDVCRPSRSGMTYAPSTGGRGVAVLTWCLEDSRAKTSAQPAREQVSTAPALDSGAQWPESFARWDRASCSWKTPQCSLLAGLDEWSETWPRWGMMRDGECSAQSMPALRISEKEFGLLPTPKAMDSRSAGPGTKDETLIRRNNSGFGVNLAEWAQMDVRKMWPTVRSSDGERGGRGDLIQAVRGNENTHFRLWQTPVADDAIDRTRGKVNSRGEPKLSAQVKLWPTPTAQDAKNNGAPALMERNTKPLNAEVGGSLNPTWVEWLMGWPLGWTDCAASATDRYRQWCDSHGVL